MANAHENGLTVPHLPEMSARATPELEQRLHAMVTPERARLIAYAATKKTEFLSPAAHAITPDLETRLKLGVPAELADNLPFTAGERVSEERREAYWQEGERANLSFAEQNKLWNEGIHTTIRRLITKPENTDQQKTQKAELAKETLQHLGLTGADDTQDKPFTSAQKGSQTVTLYSDIETFRQTYFAGKSDIRGFVKKIAAQCTRGNGTVDVPLLTKRLAAIKPVLVSFGDQSVDSLVEDYAVCYGLLTQQDARVRDIIDGETKANVQSEITDTARKGIYAVVSQTQEEIDREEAQRQQPSAEPEQPTQVFPQPPANSEQRREEAEETRGEEPVREPTPGIQSDVQGQQPENGEFARKVGQIEEKLQERLGSEIALSPRQKDILRNMPEHYTSRLPYTGYDFGTGPITDNEFTHIFEGQYMRLKNKNKSHEEIMRELDQMLRTIHISKDRIREEGEQIIIEFEEEDERGNYFSKDRIYSRIP